MYIWFLCWIHDGKLERWFLLSERDKKKTLLSMTERINKRNVDQWHTVF